MAVKSCNFSQYFSDEVIPINTTAMGLSSARARELTAAGKVNVQIDRTAKTTKDIIKENVLTYFNLIFLIISILLIAAGAFTSLTFLPVVIANMLIGIFQELHAKKVLDNLSILHEPTSICIRDGVEEKVPIEKLVLGDVILLKGGNQIPADAKILKGEVAVNEALLTGEAEEIVKGAGDELMSGAFVVSGECYAELTRVGQDAYISGLMLKARKMPVGEQSEMVRSINRIVIAAGIVIIPIGIILFVQSYVTQGNNFSDSVTGMVAAVIGMIPEGLYLLVSVTLATSTVLLARRKVMLHDMKSIETLARVDTLCVDKTGTITDNSMLVADSVPAVSLTPEQEKRYMNLVGDYLEALPDDNITMRAMREFFRGRGNRQPVSLFPFSSKFKYSSVQFTDSIYVLGAPEFVLCEDYERYSDEVESYAQKGLRVLVFGRFMGDGIGSEVRRSLPVPKKGLNGMKVEPIFFILLQNPLRENAKKIFQYFDRQGVEVKVISGDNPMTVSEVARQAGIPNSDSYVDASWLRTDEDIAEAAVKYTVFGRVTPDQKQKIVRALKEEDHVVAMTGDGVNDILAMKSADCSVAMAAGSDAAVQAAQVVLLDSDFAHMPQIVSEGRRVINNVERSATLFLVKNIFSLLLSVFSIINVLVYPLQPSQISLISMFNIGIPAFFLAMEPNNRRIEGNFLRRVLRMPEALVLDVVGQELIHTCQIEVDECAVGQGRAQIAQLLVGGVVGVHGTDHVVYGEQESPVEVPCELCLEQSVAHVLVLSPVVEVPSVADAGTILQVVACHHVAYNHMCWQAEEAVPRRVVPDAECLGGHTQSHGLGGGGRLLHLFFCGHAGEREGLFDTAGQRGQAERKSHSEEYSICLFHILCFFMYDVL